mmetsp:Transcript_593/g.1717  ORF Transcript_593/g.1717 Transcript_593/m.1717 type:complete len:195 (-) Transcript_593:498-1082(-)
MGAQPSMLHTLTVRDVLREWPSAKGTPAESLLEAVERECHYTPLDILEDCGVRWGDYEDVFVTEHYAYREARSILLDAINANQYYASFFVPSPPWIDDPDAARNPHKGIVHRGRFPWSYRIEDPERADDDGAARAAPATPRRAGDSDGADSTDASLTTDESGSSPDSLRSAKPESTGASGSSPDTSRPAKRKIE